MIGDNNTQEFVKVLIERNQRLDGRELFQMRNVQVQFTDKHGCLLYSQGMTQVLIKTSAQIVMPKPEKPAQGFVFFKVNCLSCPRSFDYNKKNANELTKLLEKVIVGSNCLDPQSLCILTGKYVWQLTIDCIVVKDCGNIIDAVLNATIAALMDFKKPLVSIEKAKVILSQKSLPLSIAHVPVSMTFGLVGNSIFIDSSLQEQFCAQSRITVSLNVYNEICSIHKPGGKGITESVISGVVKICQKKVRHQTNQLRQLVLQRPTIQTIF